MKTTIKSIGRAIIAMTVTVVLVSAMVVLFSPMMPREAFANCSANGGNDNSVPTGGQCPGYGAVYTCQANGSCTAGSGTGGGATPEMSDYLAMAFIVIAGGMVYRMRQTARA